MKKIRHALLILASSLLLISAAHAADADPQATPTDDLNTTLIPETANDEAVQPSSPLPAVAVQSYEAKVIDAKTQAPISGALVTLDDTQVATTADGSFHIEGKGETLKLRAPGYARQELATNTLSPNQTISLTPFKVKGLFLTGYGLASRVLRENAIQVLKTNKMNALVIDMKGDHGFITFKVDIPLAKEIGAQNRILIKDAPAMIAALKQQNIYLIARIVTFKDDLLAGAKPQWAVRKGGEIFRDHEKLRWADPFRPEVWDYNIQIAKAAAELGFDEVQFDYVRCPDTKGVTFSEVSNRETRTKAISSFLTAAHKALIPYNVMVSADIFGYVAWNKDDTGIGQEVDKVINAVDVVSFMLYPSGFQFGIPNYRNPVKHAYEIVNHSLKRAQERTHASPLRFRPWLQAFRDYAFGKEPFEEDKMRLQIKASDDFGASGYMFWNPRNVYPKGEFAD